MILQGTLSSVKTFEDGNTSYTVKDKDNNLFRFTESTPLTDGKKPIIQGSVIQVELEAVTGDDGHEVVKSFERRDGSSDSVSVCRMRGWYLVESAKTADEKRNAKPLVKSA